MDDPIVTPLLELVGPRHHLPLDVEVSLPGPVLLRRDVVIRGAGLENVNKGEALVLNRPPDQVLKMPDVVGVPPRDEGVARGQREKDRVDALIDVRLREGLRLRSEEHTSELQSPYDLVCRLLLEIKNTMMAPQFVLRELQQVADSSDSLKGNLCRRGLDILQKMQKMTNVSVQIVDTDFPDILRVD